MKNLFFLLFALLTLMLTMTACSDSTGNTCVAADSANIGETIAAEDIVFAKRGEECEFWLTYNVD
ncbi:MAG: hypothetical protein J6I42_12085, partial [Clostridia bacterium]|nr:hypothetical protein [Clostridia bacterium]